MTLRIDKKPAVTGICGYCQIPRADPLLKSAVIPHSAPRQKPEVPYQRNRWFADSPLEEDGFELAVPPRRERLWGATPGKHRRLGPEPVSGSAFRAAVRRCR